VLGRGDTGFRDRGESSGVAEARRGEVDDEVIRSLAEDVGERGGQELDGGEVRFPGDPQNDDALAPG
jgi:hypothetical protein